MELNKDVNYYIRCCSDIKLAEEFKEKHDIKIDPNSCGETFNNTLDHLYYYLTRSMEYGEEGMVGILFTKECKKGMRKMYWVHKIDENDGHIENNYSPFIKIHPLVKRMLRKLEI